METKLKENGEKEMLLHSFLGWMEQQLRGRAKDAAHSQTLLGMGLKDGLAQELEAFVNNPLDAMLNAKTGMDTAIRSIINVMVETYLKSKAGLVSKALLAAQGTGNALFYCISLTEDNLENRIEVNDFFDFYEDKALSGNYPVYFQFVPEKYMPNIKYQKEIAI